MEYNIEDIKRTYKMLNHTKETEIRLIDPSRKNPPKSIFVHNEDEFVSNCITYNGLFNIYAGINERTSGGTAAKDVISIKTIVIDIDPIREINTASTYDELDSADRTACQIQSDMLGMGFEKPIKAMSGNGCQLWFKIPTIEVNDDFRSIVESKIKVFNKWFIERYSNNRVNIDNIGDLPRIIKVIGTKSIKGKHSEERPHRISCWTDKYEAREDKALKEFIMKLEDEIKKLISTEKIKLSSIDDSKLKEIIDSDEKLKDLLEGRWEKYYQNGSRSEAEQGLVVKLIKYKINKEQIYSIMQKCKIGKWQEKDSRYWDRTFDNALRFYMEHQTDEEVHNVQWNKGGFLLKYYLAEKPSQDKIEVFIDNECEVPKVKWNLRDSLDGREKFLKKFKDYIDEKDLKEISQKIVSVSSVSYVSSVASKCNQNIILYTYMNDSLLSTYLIHPALDFVNDEMFVGVDLNSTDDNGLIDVRKFILTNSGSMLSIPELPDYNIQLKRSPMINKKIIFTPYHDTTQVAQATQDTLKTCYNSVLEKLKYYIDFDNPQSYTYLAIWCLGTYVYKLFNAYPYTTLYGYKASGKTRVMDVCSFVCFNGQKSVGISASALFRGTDMMSWTLFFDESGILKDNQKNKSKRAEEIEPILLEGYKKNAYIPRVGSKEEGYKIEFYDSFCPKMFASTDEMGEILESRAIQIVMRPAGKDTQVSQREPSESDACWMNIRSSLLYCSLKEWRNIRDIYSKLENTLEIRNREWEICKPILSIGKYVLNEEEYNSLGSYLEENLAVKKDEVSDKSDFNIIRALIKLDTWNDILTTEDILNKSVSSGMRPDWMNASWLGRRLKKFGLKFESSRRSHGKNYIFDKDNVYKCAERFGIDISEDMPVKVKKDDEQQTLEFAEETEGSSP